MKRWKLFFILPVIVCLAFLGVAKVFGQLELPRISTACEDKSGLLYSFNDGFSVFKRCSGNSRRVILIGEQGLKGDKGDQGEPGSDATCKNLKTFDDNGIELGIYVDAWTVFYPPLQRFIRIDLSTRKSVTDNIFYSEQNCTGNAYVGIGDMRGLSSILTSDGLRLYINELNTHPVPVALNSYSSTEGICSNLTAIRDYWLLTPVSLPFSFPIPIPLHYRY